MKLKRRLQLFEDGVNLRDDEENRLFVHDLCLDEYWVSLLTVNIYRRKRSWVFVSTIEYFVAFCIENVEINKGLTKECLATSSCNVLKRKKPF